jgi:hypothetical protein
MRIYISAILFFGRKIKFNQALMKKKLAEQINKKHLRNALAFGQKTKGLHPCKPFKTQIL